MLFYYYCFFSVWQNHCGVCLEAVFETGSCQWSSHSVQETCKSCNGNKQMVQKEVMYKATADKMEMLLVFYTVQHHFIAKIVL